MKKILFSILVLLTFVGCASTEKRKEFFNKKEYSLLENGRKTNKILVLDNGNFYGFSGINNYFGNYKLNGNKIKFERLGGTLASGNKIELTKEKEYLNKIDKITSYNIKENTLIFKLSTKEKMYFISK